MAAVEALESSSALPEPQTLTEISDDEINLPPSDDEDDALAAAKKEPVAADGDAAEDNDEAAKNDPQMNGVMVLTLLDKIIGAVDQIQQTQNGLETRQQEMERTVTSIQGELTKLTKSHSTTSNSVNKMMEKVRKVSVNVKTVRANLEKQGGQIKKLENNEAELLKRRNFKVMIYQDDVKVPSRLNISKSMKVSESVSGSRKGSMLELKEDGEEHALEEGGEGEKADKPHVDLSSDEEGVDIEDVIEESRAERIKRSSLQRVQTLKTVFSKEKMDKTKAKTKENLERTKQKTKDNIEKTKQKTKENLERTKQKTKDNIEKTKQKTRENLEKTRHNIEKKMSKLGTRMAVNPEQKQKIQTSREKKIREGAVEVVQGTEMVEVSQDPDPFSGVDEAVEEAAEEVEMEMMNGGGEDDEADEDEEEDSHNVHQENEDRDRDSD
uniref:Caveolae associated protein 1b n=1 Tax=Cynoglossus semilaevis TaxID=244447 RepID=A0A3P8VPT1_CYNSE